ncbi:NACHT, LRR and PYD domains-containing protein 4E isoform X1 [Iris pallida]|uniref:NACHT, LRR and PYD domains-containing protein 4E isoform X1 n=1 Tax=Iris pallida TaxID=29817 RepID=A0AAX6F7M9_IRIPA|nr:NACHT, LRR and PYD domains-containing protein 4E isoform X1 [Iris pallida]
MQTTSSVTLEHGVEICKSVNHSPDWLQLYWEAHLQNCLDEVAERALLPAFDGHISGVEVSDSILNSIGYMGGRTHDYSRLSYHCNKFGQYARCLRLQSVFCVAETCDLLKTCKLQALTFRRIMHTYFPHVAGLCMLLKQNRETLLSIELVYSQLSPACVNQIFNSIYKEGAETHEIRHLSIRSSVIFGYKSSLIPDGLSSFLSAGRALETLCFYDTRMGPKFANYIFSTLLESSGSLISLEISENEIAGWLSGFHKKSISLSSQSNISNSLKVLNLRGNNFCKVDAEYLSQALIKMPNLRSLDISENPIEDDGIRKLIPYFIKAFEKVYPISDIKLDNCNLSCLGVTDLLRSLPMSKEPLNSFSIADNNLGSSVASVLAKFLSTSHVRVLNIEGIGLGTTGFQELQKEMPNKVEVVCINISKNRGGIRTAHFVSELILHAPDLVAVNAGYNFLPLESLPIIHDLLRQSKGKLEHLDLSGNIIPCSSVKESRILEFQYRGKPIVTFPPYLSSSILHDDDP